MRHALKQSPGINRKSKVLYSGPRFLSSTTWHSMPKKHPNGIINQLINMDETDNKRDLPVDGCELGPPQLPGFDHDVLERDFPLVPRQSLVTPFLKQHLICNISTHMYYIIEIDYIWVSSSKSLYLDANQRY